jgi:hypothetical protein
VIILQEKGWLLLPKFSEQDVKDPSSAENPESPGKTATEPHNEPALDPGKPQSVRFSLVCMCITDFILLIITSIIY